MKLLPNFLRALLLALVLHLNGRADAQSVDLSASVSTDATTVSNAVVFTIDVTNNSLALEEIWITNTFSGTVPVTLVSDSPSNSITTTSNSATGFFGSVDIGNIAQMTLTIEPAAMGRFTDTITVNSEAGITNSIATTNLSVQVISTNVADLGVTMSGFPTIAYSNDWVTYDVTVSNAGPATATGVILTNDLPTNAVELIGISPTNEANQATNDIMTFNLGNLAVGAIANIQLTVQFTNTGVFPFGAFVTSPNQLASNPANNTFTTNVTVTNFLAGTADLTAVVSSAQVYNHQTAREQQMITLSNTGTNTVMSARVIVTGLTNWLSNAVGTNNGNPYVVYGAPMTNGQSVNLTLQFYPDYQSFPFSNSQLTPVEIEQADLSLPATGITSSSINITLVTNLSSGYMLLEFKAITNRLYTVAYSDSGTNWLAAQPPFHVSANYGLWIDYGPPETLNPTNTFRMYQVYMYPQSP
ncbi:MAG: hypothetical protein ACLQSR_06490 [Limisphaerales bacterium]